MSFNISIPQALADRAAEYQKERKMTRSALVQYALEKLFASETPDKKRDQCLERAIKRWVNIPFTTSSAQANYGFLYMLGTKYPNQSAKTFWTDACFIGPRDVTHKEMLNEIKNAFEILYNG